MGRSLFKAAEDRCMHQQQEEKVLEHSMTLAPKRTDSFELQSGTLEGFRAAVVEGCSGDPSQVHPAMMKNCTNKAGGLRQARCSYLFQTPKNIPTRDSLFHGAATGEPLLCALRARSLEKIAIILAKDPDQATMPFTGGQPPICEAIKHQCEVVVIDLLIAHGADPSMPDCHGRSALLVLASIPRKHVHGIQGWHRFAGSSNLHGPFGSMPNFQWPPSNWQPGVEQRFDSSELEQKATWICQVGERLLRAGCEPMQCDPNGNSAKTMATENGWEALAELIHGWKDFKVCLMLHRSLSPGRPCSVKNSTHLAKLNFSQLRCIYQFVVGSNYFV